MRLPLVAAAALAVIAAGCSEPSPAPHLRSDQATAQLFQRRCAVCHGVAGSGDTGVGKAFPNANLADGTFVHGSAPEDVARTIASGIPGTPMLGMSSQLSPDQIRELTDYVLQLRR